MQLASRKRAKHHCLLRSVTIEEVEPKEPSCGYLKVKGSTCARRATQSFETLPRIVPNLVDLMSSCISSLLETKVKHREATLACGIVLSGLAMSSKKTTNII